MNRFSNSAFGILLVCFVSAASANDIAPSGTLRAVYLGTNPAQAVRDPASG